MSSEPTINDFLGQLEMHSRAATEELGQRITALKADMNRRGLLRSGPRVRATLTALEECVDQAISAVLDELRRFFVKTDHDKATLRSLAAQRLEEIVRNLIHLADPAALTRVVTSGSNVPEIDRRVAGLAERLAFRLRQFDVGLDRSAQQDVAAKTQNTVNAEVIFGSVQQAGSHSTQHSHVAIDLPRAIEAVEALEAGLATIEAPAHLLEEIRGDLDTIKAQLRKPKPTRVILIEAAKSVKNIVEGGLGGLLAPAAVAAASALFSALAS